MLPKAIVFLVLLVAAFAERSHLDFQGKVYKPFLSRVTGGSEAPEASYPYIVSLQWNINNVHYHFCAGSILNNQWILTAAHCLHEIFLVGINNVVVKAGKHNIQIVESTEQIVQIEQIFKHEKYLSSYTFYDIGLIKLKNPLKFTKEIQAIELSQAENESIKTAYLCGWGLILSDNVLSDPDKLQHIKLTYIDHKICNLFVKIRLGYSLVDETNICTGPSTNRISACNGDSGGPLITYYGQKPVLIGIISWIIPPCGTSPTVYTKVSKFNAWIKEKIANYTTHLY
ncbi:chymotrypsinogen B-like [Cataglyphis hispanica]|uniref:chymotrypsinogen B-like n=1 Tax=Cataglyphis hispanica TaxID=1086592 RepID=UPI00218047D4|nr:chymotrypsinogen B-like [Cataglyphis hispanica]